MNARETIDQLGAVWSPSFSDYAQGKITATEVVCVLCGPGDCRCAEMTMDEVAVRTFAAFHNAGKEITR